MVCCIKCEIDSGALDDKSHVPILSMGGLDPPIQRFNQLWRVKTGSAAQARRWREIVIWLFLFLVGAQQVFNLCWLGVNQRGQTQGRLADLRCGHGLYLRGLNLWRSRWIGPLIKQLSRVFGFAFQRSRQILACHTSLWAALTKTFEVCNGFSSGGKGGEGGRLKYCIAACHLLRGRRRWQGKQNAPQYQSFAYQSHPMQIPFRFFLRWFLIPRLSCWPIKPLKRIRFKFA